MAFRSLGACTIKLNGYLIKVIFLKDRLLSNDSINVHASESPSLLEKFLNYGSTKFYTTDPSSSAS